MTMLLSQLCRGCSRFVNVGQQRVKRTVPLLMLLLAGGSMGEARAQDLVAAKEFDFQAPPSAPDNLPSVIVPRDPTLPTLEPSPDTLSPQPTLTPPAGPTTPIRSAPLPQAETYLVYVNGNSALMLDQVKRVEPEAFRKQYQGRTVIQVGQFYNQTNAQRRAEDLMAQGIQAQVAQVSGSGTKQVQDSKGYYVVIPAGDREIAAILEQVRRLAGTLQVSVNRREQPRGRHITVGRFTSYADAKDWNRYLKDFGIPNARIHYGRY